MGKEKNSEGLTTKILSEHKAEESARSLACKLKRSATTVQNCKPQSKVKAIETDSSLDKSARKSFTIPSMCMVLDISDSDNSAWRKHTPNLTLVT